jgi:uncharacterized protein YeaO (DUF488 family)
MGIVKGKLYTGRIYDYQKIREEYGKVLLICVMRWQPRFLNLEKKNILHLLGLSPSPKLLGFYKKRMQRKKISVREKEDIWKEYVKRFLKEMEGSLAQQDRFLVRCLLGQGVNIVLLCHESADQNCHRRILPSVILTGEEFEDGVFCGEVILGDTIQTKLDL